MNRIIFLLTLFILSITVISFADNTEQVITLKDGSQIIGELTGISNGVYTIKAPIIGDVHANASDVVSITNRNASPAGFPGPGSAPTMDQQIAAQQQKLMSNPQDMAELQQIAQDPQIVQMLQDPALMQAVTNHDYQAVQNNPAVKQLMNNPRMQALIQKMKAQQKQQESASQ